MNSGIQDADNLVWKLSLAIKNAQSNFESLLDSYDQERRPIGERVAKTSLYNMRAHALVLDEALGLSPTKSEAENIQAMEQYFDSTDEGQGLAKRKEVMKAMEDLDVEFYAHGAEVGWFYDFEYNGTYESTSNQDVNPQRKEDGEMELCTYHPTTRPGNQLPHAWLVRKSSREKLSTRELVVRDKLMLLAMSKEWKLFENPFVDVQIVHESGDLSDSTGDWKGICGELEKVGALLVRPDNIIAYRFIDDQVLQESDFRDRTDEIVKTVLKMAK